MQLTPHWLLPVSAADHCKLCPACSAGPLLCCPFLLKRNAGASSGQGLNSKVGGQGWRMNLSLSSLCIPDGSCPCTLHLDLATLRSII